MSVSIQFACEDEQYHMLCKLVNQVVLTTQSLCNNVLVLPQKCAISDNFKDRTTSRLVVRLQIEQELQMDAFLGNVCSSGLY